MEWRSGGSLTTAAPAAPQAPGIKNNRAFVLGSLSVGHGLSHMFDQGFPILIPEIAAAMGLSTVRVAGLLGRPTGRVQRHQPRRWPLYRPPQVLLGSDPDRLHARPRHHLRGRGSIAQFCVPPGGRFVPVHARITMASAFGRRHFPALPQTGGGSRSPCTGSVPTWATSADPSSPAQCSACRSLCGAMSSSSTPASPFIMTTFVWWSLRGVGSEDDGARIPEPAPAVHQRGRASQKSRGHGPHLRGPAPGHRAQRPVQLDSFLPARDPRNEPLPAGRVLRLADRNGHRLRPDPGLAVRRVGAQGGAGSRLFHRGSAFPGRGQRRLQPLADPRYGRPGSLQLRPPPDHPGLRPRLCRTGHRGHRHRPALRHQRRHRHRLTLPRRRHHRVGQLRHRVLLRRHPDPHHRRHHPDHPLRNPSAPEPARS